MNAADFSSTVELESNIGDYERLQFCQWYTSDNKPSEKPQAGLNTTVYYVHGYYVCVNGVYGEDKDTVCIPVGKIVLDNKLNPIFKLYMKNPQTPKKNDPAYKVSFEVKLTGCRADLVKAQQQAGKLFKNYKQLILNSIDKPDHYDF